MHGALRRPARRVPRRRFHWHARRAAHVGREEARRPAVDAALPRARPAPARAVTRARLRDFYGREGEEKSDAKLEQLRLVDKALTDCVQNVALSLGAAQLALTAQQFDKLDQIAMLVSNANDNKTLAPDSAATKEIADLLGVQLDDMNSSLTEALSDIKARTESIDAKLDRLLAATRTEGTISLLISLSDLAGNLNRLSPL